MGLPMLNRSPKAGPSDEETTNKPPVTNSNNNHTNTRNPAVPHLGSIYGSSLGSSSSSSSSTSASSSTASTDDRTLRWERLHSLRNRLVDRMYRLEMDELLNNNNGNNSSGNNENGEGSSAASQNTQTTAPTSSARPIPVVAASRPVPIPTGRPIQVSSGGSAHLNGPDAVRSWALLHHPGENTETQGNIARTEVLQARREGRDSRRRAEETRRILEARRRASQDMLPTRQTVDSRGESLMTVEEFLRESRESREPYTDNDEYGPSASGPQRSSSIPPINRLRTGDPYRLDRWVNRNRAEMPGDGRLDIIHLDERVSPAITVPQTLPAAAWWPLETLPPGHHMAPNETFDTFINHIRRIGHLQDAMLATIRSSNSALVAEGSTLAAEVTASASGTHSAEPATGNSGTSPSMNSTGLEQSSSTSPSAASSTARPATPTSTSDAATNAATPAPSLNVAEARLRAMQTRIDILTSEFSLLRSSWALSHVENQGYERSLRRLQEYLPGARRAERLRRGNRGGEVSLHYEDLHADSAAREEDLFLRNPWGDSDAERNRERMRQAAVGALGRGLFTSEMTGSTGSTETTGVGRVESQVSGAVATTPAESTVEPFSLAERELQKKMLAAKMEELILRGMR